MISKDIFESLISDMNLGTSTAEKDPLLETAQIKTPEFNDVYTYDRIDIIRGVKGAGKTALYRLFYLLSDYVREKDNLVLVFGVEPTGDPVFTRFRKYFEKFDEIDFQNFWVLYFMSLLRERIEEDTIFEKLRSDPEFAGLDEALKKINIVPGTRKNLLDRAKDAFENVLNFSQLEPSVTSSVKADGSFDIKTSFGLTPGQSKNDKTPIYVGDIREKLCGLLKHHGIRMWVMLDRLDEVFQRLSHEEEMGLKGLLKAAYNISEPELRIKLFLRDDIIQQLASAESGFTALTHVTDRASSTLRWSTANILLLTVKRFFASKSLALYFDIDAARLDRDPEYRAEMFYKVFPPKIGKAATFEWLMSSLKDGNDIVTPRDVIDFFGHAKAIQARKFQLDPKDQPYIVGEDTLKEALVEVSKDKKNRVLLAEYPHMRNDMLKLEGGKSNLTFAGLEKLYGSNWKKLANDFASIGLLRFDSKKAQYKVPKLWALGLGVRQGTAL